MTDPHRDKTRVASARRGIAQARATLTIRWDRVTESWWIDDREYSTLLEAENSITRGDEA